MPSQNPLTPHITPPPRATHTLTLLTSLLSSPSTWLTHKLIAQHLTPTPTRTDRTDPPSTPPIRLLLISLTQDRAFHVDSLRKLGIPHKILHPPAFQFLGITDLQLTRTLSARVLRVLRESADAAAAASGGGEDVVVVLEGPDILLHAGVGYSGAMDLVMGVLEVAKHTIVCVNVDEALMRDEEHAAFVVGLGHIAGRVFGLRALETGVARDVSGVLRITAGGMGEREGEGESEEKEVLYFVGDGGGVEVFERGEVRGV